jgi:hypothetical protein
MRPCARSWAPSGRDPWRVSQVLPRAGTSLLPAKLVSPCLPLYVLAFQVLPRPFLFGLLPPRQCTGCRCQRPLAGLPVVTSSSQASKLPLPFLLPQIMDVNQGADTGSDPPPCPEGPCSELMLRTPRKRARRSPHPLPPLRALDFGAAEEACPAADVVAAPTGAAEAPRCPPGGPPTAERREAPTAEPAAAPAAAAAQTPPPQPGSAAAAGGGCYLMPRRPTARRLFSTEHPVPPEVVADFLTAMEEQVRPPACLPACPPQRL